MSPSKPCVFAQSFALNILSKKNYKSVIKKISYLKPVCFILGLLLISGIANAQTITVSALSPNSATTTYGIASSNMVFTVSGSGLTAGITINPPSGFSISTSPGSGFQATNLTIGTGGTIANTTIYALM
jgi:hypothetical protein